MSIKEANKTSINMESPLISIDFNEKLKDIIKINKNQYNNFNKKIYYTKKNNSIDKRQNICFKNKHFLNNIKIKELIEEEKNNYQKKYNYKDKISDINKIFININKYNKNKLNNIFKHKTENNIVNKEKNVYSFNGLSNNNFNIFYSNNNKNPKNISFSSTNRTTSNNTLSYNNNENNIEKKYSFSINHNSSYIFKLLNEEDDYMNIEIHKNNKSNTKLLNKFYSFRQRERDNYKYPNIIEYNKNIKLLNLTKIVDKNINSKTQKNLIIKKNNQNIDYINYVNSINNNSIKNLKFNSIYFHNILSHKNKINKKKIFQNTFLKSYLSYLDSIREERKTNRFIKELNHKKNLLLYTSKFSYDKENIDTNIDFYLTLKSNKTNEKENKNFLHKSNYEQNRISFREKKSLRSNKNSWKKKNYKPINSTDIYLNVNPKSYIVKQNIMPSNNIAC